MVRAAIFFSMITTLVIASYADEGNKNQPTSKPDPNVRDSNGEPPSKATEPAASKSVKYVTENPVPLDLGYLSVGRNIELLTTFENPYDFELTFSGKKSSCYCTKLQADQTMPSKGHASSRITIETGDEERNTEVVAGVAYKDKDGNLYVFQRAFKFAVFDDCSWGAKHLSFWLRGIERSRIEFKVANNSPTRWMLPTAVVDSNKVGVDAKSVIDSETGRQTLVVSLTRSNVDLEKSFDELNHIELREYYSENSEAYSVIDRREINLRQRAEYEIVPKSIFLQHVENSLPLKFFLLASAEPLNEKPDGYQVLLDGKEVVSTIQPVSEKFLQISILPQHISIDAKTLKVIVKNEDRKIVGYAEASILKP